mmetsp:Transcript_120154/g.285487  ORF Transcript_120154/g.285487 Transcript_120154/m.285487 type:complete len:489 (-) Transcript_120154:52-1518(-)
MVEGPSCKRKAERLQVLLYQRVLAVLAACGSHPSDLDRCRGQMVRKVATVGKELFLVLDNLVIRLHFGMSGGADFVCAGHEASRVHRRPRSTGVEFQFSNGRLVLRDATARVTTFAYLANCEARRPFDILNPSFDWEGAIKRLKEAAADRKVCDLVMDQLLLPGVGNVIKVEGLFAARVHPLTPGKALSDSCWWALLRGLRDCALQWYSALKGRGKLFKVCYGRKTCSHCRSQVVLMREGALRRISYYCPTCQVGDSNRCVQCDPNSALNPGCRQGEPGAKRSQTDCAVRELVRPQCSCRQACELKQTFKPGPNRERHFFTCAKQRCRTFQWLDAQLPTCAHGRTKMRQVLKLGANNGRFFAACPLRCGCDFFQWLRWKESEIPQHEHGVQSRLTASLTRDERTATFCGTGTLFSRCSRLQVSSCKRGGASRKRTIAKRQISAEPSKIIPAKRRRSIRQAQPTVASMLAAAERFSTSTSSCVIDLTSE